MTAYDDLMSLNKTLDEARGDLAKLDRYVTGTQPLAFLDPKVAEDSQNRLQSMVVNWARVIVEVIEQRLDVEGFRVGGRIEDRLWRLWQASNMDEASQLAHLDALILGRSYAMVWATNEGRPLITAESPMQTYVKTSPGTGRRLLAVKRWVDGGDGHAVLFYPDRVVRFVVDKVPDETSLASWHSLEGVARWRQVGTLPNPLGLVPVVPLSTTPAR